MEISEWEDLYAKVVEWWNPMDYGDKRYNVWYYEGGTVPVAALSEGAIIRLYFKTVLGLTHQEALAKYHSLLKNAQ